MRPFLEHFGAGVTQVLTRFRGLLLERSCNICSPDSSFPDFGQGADVDLRELCRGHGWFFGLTVALAIVSIAKDCVVNGALPHSLELTFYLIFMSMTGLAAVTRSEWYHKVVAHLGVVLRPAPA